MDTFEVEALIYAVSQELWPRYAHRNGNIRRSVEEVRHLPIEEAFDAAFGGSYLSTKKDKLLEIARNWNGIHEG